MVVKASMEEAALWARTEWEAASMVEGAFRVAPVMSQAARRLEVAFMAEVGAAVMQEAAAGAFMVEAAEVGAMLEVAEAAAVTTEH
jgi:hypothetical protein